MDADKAPVGALGELKPGQLFKKYKNNLWYPVGHWRGYPLLVDEVPYLTSVPTNSSGRECT